MSRSSNPRNTTVAAMLGALLFLAAPMAHAAEGHSDMPAVGRFQIACTDTLCYLVYTVTGQVWTSNDPEFHAPKLSGLVPAKTDEPQGYVGRWVSDDPDETDLGLRLEPDGKAVATEGSKRYEGRWRVDGTRLILNVEDESLAGEMMADGRLSLWEQDNADRRVAFRRASEESQAPQAAPALASEALLGQWASETPDGKEVKLQFETAGLAIASHGSDRYEGRWRLEGKRISVTVNDSTVTGELQPDGRLILREEDDGDEQLIFKRVSQERQESAAETSEGKGFLGRWACTDPDEEDVGLRIEPNGRAVGTEGERSYEGRWRIEGTRLILSIDNDDLVGELQPDGCLSLHKDGEGDERVVFKRVP